MILERGQFKSKDGLNVADGEAGTGIYAYIPNIKMREYYTKNGEDLIFIKINDKSSIIDLTKEVDKLIFYIRKNIEFLAAQMDFYQIPKITKENYQRFGRQIENYIRENYYNADGYIVQHKGFGVPTGKQVIIKNQNAIEILDIINNESNEAKKKLKYKRKI